MFRLNVSQQKKKKKKAYLPQQGKEETEADGEKALI